MQLDQFVQVLSEEAGEVHGFAFDGHFPVVLEAGEAERIVALLQAGAPELDGRGGLGVEVDLESRHRHDRAHLPDDLDAWVDHWLLFWRVRLKVCVWGEAKLMWMGWKSIDRSVILALVGWHSSSGSY